MDYPGEANPRLNPGAIAHVVEGQCETCIRDMSSLHYGGAMECRNFSDLGHATSIRPFLAGRARRQTEHLSLVLPSQSLVPNFSRLLKVGDVLEPMSKYNSFDSLASMKIKIQYSFLLLASGLVTRMAAKTDERRPAAPPGLA